MIESNVRKYMHVIYCTIYREQGPGILLKKRGTSEDRLVQNIPQSTSAFCLGSFLSVWDQLRPLDAARKNLQSESRWCTHLPLVPKLLDQQHLAFLLFGDLLDQWKGLRYIQGNDKNDTSLHASQGSDLRKLRPRRSRPLFLTVVAVPRLDSSPC